VVIVTFPPDWTLNVPYPPATPPTVVLARLIVEFAPETVVVPTAPTSLPRVIVAEEVTFPPASTSSVPVPLLPTSKPPTVHFEPAPVTVTLPWEPPLFAMRRSRS
jgi:hypothetical protein